MNVAKEKKETLGSQAIKATGWVFLERISLEVFRFITTLILARILGPKEFGLVALTTIFISVSITFIDSGFTKALIQKKDTTVEDESTIFYFNLIISLIFILIINLTAHQVSIYYEEPRLEEILRALSLTLLFFAFRQIQQVILTKKLNFKLQFKANVVGTILSGIIGLILAFNGFGVWSIVIQNILDSLIKTMMFWYVSSWRPKLVFSGTSFREFYRFGLNLFLNDLLKSISENVYGIVIGKYYNQYQLGLYDRGNKLASLIITNFQFSIQKVTFPVFVKVQHDKVELKKTVKKSLDLILFLVTPAMVFLIVTAKPVTLILLSDKWIEMVPYVQLFCVYWLFFPFSGVNNHLVLALGKSNIILYQSLWIYGIQALILIITINMGIYYIIVGQIVAMIGRQLILIYYAKKLINFGYKEQLIIFSKYLIYSGISGSSVYIFSVYIANQYVLLILQLSIGVSIYMMLNYIFKSESLNILINQMQKLINKQKNG